MKITVKGREITVDDKLAEIYTTAAGKFDDKMAVFLLETEDVNIDKLSDKELEEQLAKTMLKEAKDREYLSRPEMMQAAAEFADRKK